MMIGILGGYKVPPKRVRHDPGRGPRRFRRTHTGGRGGLHSPSNCQTLPSGRGDYHIRPYRQLNVGGQQGDYDRSRRGHDRGGFRGRVGEGRDGDV